MNNWKFIFQKMQSKILLHKKVLAGVSILSLCVSFAGYFFGEVAPHNICMGVYYTSAYSQCGAYVTEYARYFEVAFGTLSLIIPLIFISAEPVIRGRFFKFLKWYIPLATVFTILGYYAQFCFMMSCSSELGTALAVDLFVFAAFFLSIGWSILVSRHFLAITVLFSILIFFVAQSVMTFAEEVKNVPQEINQKASNDSGQSCYQLNGVRERDQCLFLNGFQCNKIVSSDIKQECSDIRQRNQAVEDVDINECNKIIEEVQKSVCYKLVQEALGRQPSQ